MYNVNVPVKVLAIIPNEKIEIEWGNKAQTSRVEWTFKVLGENETFVNVVNAGFKGNTDEIKAMIRDSTGGFNLVMAGCKIWLEKGFNPNFILDRFPANLK